MTFTGKRFDPMSPTLDDINIEDIAHALSMMCRFGGHCLRYYSVAEHSILMAQKATKKNKLWALLHDASEAYIVDVPRPLKSHLGGYKECEKNIMAVICEKFGLPQDMPDEVKHLDETILATECNHNMVSVPDNLPFVSNPLNVRLQYWNPTDAEERFLGFFYSLR